MTSICCTQPCFWRLYTKNKGHKDQTRVSSSRIPSFKLQKTPKPLHSKQHKKHQFLVSKKYLKTDEIKNSSIVSSPSLKTRYKIIIYIAHFKIKKSRLYIFFEKINKKSAEKIIISLCLLYFSLNLQHSKK